MSEELEGYLQQVCSLDAQLSTETCPVTRTSMKESRRDLMELIALLTEQDQTEPGPAASASSSTPSATEDDADTEMEDCDDLIGVHVCAPFPSARLPISLHTAIILEVLPPVDVQQGLLARVLYSTPLIQSMRPCSHFLSGTCKFEGKCKFSHGEIVPMRDFEEYLEPDFASISVDSLVLVNRPGGLWDIGRVTALSEGEAAVCLLETGKELAVKRDEIIPVAGQMDNLKDAGGNCSEDPVDIPSASFDSPRNDSWHELKGQTAGSSSVGETGQWNGGGFGLKMMQKMGYLVGQGLGKRSDGIVHPVQAKLYPTKKGLDEGVGKDASEAANAKRSKVVGRVRRAMDGGKGGKGAGLDGDIFAFLNRKLTKECEQNDHLRLKEERRQMEKCTERNLGIRTIDMENEIKQLRSKEKKLLEGMHRNRADPRTVARLQSSLDSTRREISRIEGSHSMVHKELNDRKQKKKDIF